ncbi:hypothetical protein DSECCO2_480430 [anaerobic digester metagenome]
MKRLLIIALGLTLLLMAACKDDGTNLTQVDVSELEIPADFNYAMTHDLSLDIQGSWRLPVYLKTTDGDLLFKAQLNPATGLSSKLTIPTTIKKVVLEYQMYSLTLDVSSGSLMQDFRVDR